MNMPKWISWAGLAAMIGGLTAVLLTPPFASAYFTAYPGYETPPFWVEPLRPALGNLLTFAAPRTVYNLYGRLFVLVYLLMLPAVFALHSLHRGANGRAEKWGFNLLVAGLLLPIAGVVGDYWAEGAGFLVEVLGLLILAIGATVYGVAALRIGLLPGKVAWPLALALPAVFLVMPLIRHIPSGPTFPLAIAWFITGAFLLLVGEKRPQLIV
jgi:hypothetical protein